MSRRHAIVLCIACACASGACSSSDERDGGGAGKGGMSGVSGGSGGAGGGTTGTGGGGGDNSAGAGDGGNGSGGAGGAGGASGASGAGGASSPELSLTAACLDYGAAQVVRRAECDRASELPSADEVKRSLDQCPDLFFADGATRTVDGLLACAEAWRTFSCEQYIAGLRPPCVTDGARAGGEPCLFTSQCASQRCAGADPLTCGACATRVGAGESCDDVMRVCPRGYSCERAVCVETVVGEPPMVLPQLATGEPCGDGLGMCTGDDECRPVPQDILRCISPLPLGGGCSATGTFCATDAYCNPDNYKCELRPGEGQPCGVSFGVPELCAADLRCDDADPADPTCRRRPAPTCTSAGESCAAPSSRCCVPPECLVPTCVHIQLPGEPCTDAATRCIPGTECRAGTCEPIDSQGLYDRSCGRGGG